jgi:hypothetical protein
VFSDLNNLNDITIDDNFASMLGYTQSELESYFEKHILKLSEKENISKDELLREIKNWYNGYSWNGSDFVYNPFSILNLFYKFAFGNYWFATGTPTFLVNQIKEKEVLPEKLTQIAVSEYVFDKFELRNIDVISLLFQTGYLTIKKIERMRRRFYLSYPNEEVRLSLLHNLFAGFLEKPMSYTDPIIWDLEESINNKDLETFFNTLKSLFASIPYNIFLNKEEAYYHSVIYLVLSLLGVNIDCEIQTNIGRIDAVIQLEDTIYIMEFKLESGQEAIEQIKEKKYHEKYLNLGKNVMLVGVGFGIEEKNIKEWKTETVRKS